MHGGYRRTFGPENVVELSKNIIVQHEDYLKQDDPDKKADALRYMAGYTAQYLHLVPHEKKFTFKETERVLHNSAMNIGDFDPREGSLSFRNLAKYAENLLEQPWRTDFHVIKLTSGFYVHNISAQLQNAHEILITLGYVNLDETTLKLLPNTNSSNLKAVSRDCYIASQECLILSQIWQQVADQEPDYPLTIGEVFEYRKNHLGDTDTICNKLLYDIRARMHLLKQQQPQHYPQSVSNNHSAAPILNNSQRFVPVDRLVDYGEDLNSDDPDGIAQRNYNFIPEREVDRTQELMKNVNLYKDDEHIYDPVYGGAGDSPQNYVYHQHQSQRKHSQSQNPKYSSNKSHQYYSSSNNSRKSVPVQNTFQSVLNVNPYQSQQPYHQQNSYNTNPVINTRIQGSSGYGDGRNSMSPMIPKTVAGMFSNSNGVQSSGNQSNVSKSYSMNSINGGNKCVADSATSGSSSSSSAHPQQFINQPLTRTRVKETDLDDDFTTPAYLKESSDYFSQDCFVAASGGRRENSISGTRNPRSRQSIPNNPTVPLTNSTIGHHQNQTKAHQVYPDEYYPPLVKPVAVYGASSSNNTSNLNQFYMRPRVNSDNSEEVLNDAYAYASEVSRISRTNPSSNSGEVRKGQQIHHHQTTPFPGSDSDSHSMSSENKSRGNSVKREQGSRSTSSGSVPSAREGSLVQFGGKSEYLPLASRRSEAAKRPTHIDLQHQRNPGNMIRHADSSPETDMLQTQQHHKTKSGYQELSSSSSSGSPASSAANRSYPRNEELSSLDTVYYDFLLKKGQTDEIIGNTNNADDISENLLGQTYHDETNRGSSHHRGHRHQHRHTHSSTSGRDPEENHIYDGRRVMPKKKHHQDKTTYKRGENDTRKFKNPQNPVESVIPSARKYNEPNYSDNLSSTVEVSKPSHEKNVKKSSEKECRKTPVESEIPSCSPKTFEPWDCRHCTYRNFVAERICEVCAKSKDFFEEDLSQQHQDFDPQPSSSSGQVGYNNMPKLFSVSSSSVSNPSSKTDDSSTVAPTCNNQDEVECPQCTLLNPRRAVICGACEYRLKKVESPKPLDDLDLR